MPALLENPAFLMNLPGVWVDRIHKGKLPRQIVHDMDSSVPHNPKRHSAGLLPVFLHAVLVAVLEIVSVFLLGFERREVVGFEFL